MNAPHWHLLLNHVPVLGTVFGLSLLVLALWTRRDELKRATFWAFVIVALLALPTYFTGEPSEDMVRSLPGVSKAVIETHESVANVAFVGVLALGLAALVGLTLFRKAKIVPSWFTSLVLVASLVVSGLMAWTANLGGQIRHTEIRNNVSATASQRD